jgi:hypothetical protein
MEDGDYDAVSPGQEQDQDQSARVSEDTMRSASVEELFNVLEAVSPPALSAKRAAAGKTLLGHLDKYREQEGMSRGEEQAALKAFTEMEEEEELLTTFSLQELYTLSMGDQEGLFSEFLVYRARQLLDATLSRIVYEQDA